MRKFRYLRQVAGTLAAVMLFGLAGCGGGQTVRSDSPYETAPARPAPRQQGMTTRNKVLLLAGAAAVYYMYNKHKNRQGHGPEGQYYRSRNGQIYYRDAQGKAHWVTAPSRPIEVPADEYQRYTGQRMDDYDGRVIRDAPGDFSTR